jgi:hypothetical protein
MGTGRSKFLKSIFITHQLGGDDIVLDVHINGVVFAKTLREAIDEAMEDNYK